MNSLHPYCTFIDPKPIFYSLLEIVAWDSFASALDIEVNVTAIRMRNVVRRHAFWFLMCSISCHNNINEILLSTTAAIKSCGRTPRGYVYAYPNAKMLSCDRTRCGLDICRQIKQSCKSRVKINSPVVLCQEYSRREKGKEALSTTLSWVLQNLVLHLQTLKPASNASSIPILVSVFEHLSILNTIAIMPFTKNIRHRPSYSLGTNPCSFQIASSRT